jgi:hypothetical protein
MTVSMLDNLLWAAGFVGHAALLGVLLLRRRARGFPVFTFLIAYQALVTIMLFAVYRDGSSSLYAICYWISVVGDFLFQLALIFEIARIVLRPTGTWIRDAKRTFLLWGAVGATIAIVFALLVKPPAPNSMDAWEVRGNLFTSLLTCELFLVLMMTSNKLGLAWRNHVMGLAQGLTAWALVAVTIDAAHSVLGWQREFNVLEHVRMYIYLASLGYWIVTFWFEEPERAPLPADMQQYLLDLHRRVAYDLERVKGSSSV